MAGLTRMLHRPPDLKRGTWICVGTQLDIAEPGIRTLPASVIAGLAARRVLPTPGGGCFRPSIPSLKAMSPVTAAPIKIRIGRRVSVPRQPDSLAAPP